MSLTDIIEKIRKQNTGYADPTQVDNQSQSLNTLSKDLYTEAKRFLYELLQNADDSALNGDKVSVAIRLIGDELVVAHNGKPFDDRDLRGLCGVNRSTKKKDAGKTGFKGLGFKAVFGQSTKVTIFSGGEYFRFDAGYEHEWNPAWGGTQASWEAEEDCVFEFPWQIIPIATDTREVSPAINNFVSEGNFTVATIVKLSNTTEVVKAIGELVLRVNMFLFLKHIEKIDFNIGTAQAINIDRQTDGLITLSVNTETKARWLTRTVSLVVPADVKAEIAADANIPPKLSQAVHIEMSFAAKIGDGGIEHIRSEEALLYAYLPTGENRYAIPVLINTSFLTVANRESLHENSAWNQWLFKCIPEEICKWIAELVLSEFQYQAYKILPKKLSQTDPLANVFNLGFEGAKENISFIITTTGGLIKVKEGLIDATKLSEMSFVGPASIIQYINDTVRASGTKVTAIVANTGLRSELKALGVLSYDWTALGGLLQSENTCGEFSTAKNILLISHLKFLSERDKPEEVTMDNLSNWPFILDHKHVFARPKEIYFPTPDDEHWNQPDSELSYVHPDIQAWLAKNQEIKEWLERLGATEKSDITYLQKNILPKVTTFVSTQNAVSTIQSIFNLFIHRLLDHNTIQQLRAIQLLTEGGSLIPATACYFSKVYEPRLPLEDVLGEDIYLNKAYLSVNADISELKRFFKFIGVREGINIITFPDRCAKVDLVKQGIAEHYFALPDKTFFNGYFVARHFSNLKTLFFINYCVGNMAFSKVFWADTIATTSATDLVELIEPVTAFWGYEHRDGWLSGNSVNNYLKWFVGNFQCIPVTTGQTLSSQEVFINDEEILTLGGKYLSIFGGPGLNPDWSAFFSFKTRLELLDYLNVLTEISKDELEGNKRRIQLLYTQLLNGYSNWSSQEQLLVRDWSTLGRLADVNSEFRLTSELKYYADGDTSIFQGAYYFISLNEVNKQHPNLIALLSLLNIQVLRQNEFLFEAHHESLADELSNKLRDVLPYLAKWMEGPVKGKFEQVNYELRRQFDKVTFVQADELTIKYGNSWQKKVTLHHLNDVLYVLTPWTSNKVMLSLPEKLCDILDAKGFALVLTFLLKAEREEITEYFADENKELPPADAIDETSTVTESQRLPGSATTVARHVIDYETLWDANKTRNAAIIASSANNAKTLLLAGLQAQQIGRPVVLYHFSHIENAVSIIKDGAVKSRQLASFKDSAGSGIIDQTEEERKQFARFYFKTKTPTQYYAENWGKGQISISRINSEPVCPIPVFFIFDLEQVIKAADWAVSLGTMASPQVEYGREFDIVSKFDFDGLFKNQGELSADRFKASSHQEFLVKDQLSLDGLDFRLAVQDQNAKDCLLAMLNNDPVWNSKIEINTALYNNDNPTIDIVVSPDEINAAFNERQGHFVLQYNAISPLISITDATEYFECGGVSTVISNTKVSLRGLLTGVAYNLFYCYKGTLWLVHTNFAANEFDGTYVKELLEEWLHSDDWNGAKLLAILKKHPELSYWYNQSIGGPDKLTLEEHTQAVITNYLHYFKGKQSLFDNEKEFVLFLALHDIGKPKAILLGNKHLQHEQSIIIVNKIRDILPIETNSVERVKHLINGDVIGPYLDPRYSVSLEETLQEVKKMAGSIGLTAGQLFPSLLIYYQVDAGSYPSLYRLFKKNENGSFILSSDGKSICFNEQLEAKFVELKKYIDI